jgi:hypothetical protein
VNRSSVELIGGNSMLDLRACFIPFFLFITFKQSSWAFRWGKSFLDALASNRIMSLTMRFGSFVGSSTVLGVEKSDLENVFLGLRKRMAMVAA